MTEFTHLFFVPFTGLGKPGFRGNRWLANRIRIFEGFVLPSLMSQQKREFIVWCQWRPQEKDNDIVRNFVNRMERMRGMRFVHTFHGICIWDDKYPVNEAKDRLMESIRLSLPELKHYIHGDWVYLTCQPSDDIYRLDATREIQACPPERRKAIGWGKGYIMSYATKEMREYDPETTPPFSTIVGTKDDFLDPERHLANFADYRSHEQVSVNYNWHELPGRGFIVGTHGENISTVWNHPYSRRELMGEEKLNMMAAFGCLFSDPIVIHRRVRLWGRTFVNLLPKPLHDLVRFAYNSLRSYLLR